MSQQARLESDVQCGLENKEQPLLLDAARPAEQAVLLRAIAQEGWRTISSFALIRATFTRQWRSAIPMVERSLYRYLILARTRTGRDGFANGRHCPNPTERRPTASMITAKAASRDLVKTGQLGRI